MGAKIRSLKNFRSRLAYKNFLAYTHMHGLENPCGPNVTIAGKLHKPKHTGICLGQYIK
jgi:hypothetical protein